MKKSFLKYLLWGQLCLWAIFVTSCQAVEVRQHHTPLKSDQAATGHSSAPEFVSVGLPDGRRLLVTSYEYDVAIGGREGSFKILTQNQLQQYIAYLKKTTFKSEAEAVKHVQSNFFYKPLSFEELGVENEDELLATYFDYNPSSRSGRENGKNIIPKDPAFIGLMLDLGYRVGLGDAVPFIWIIKE